MKIMRLTNPVLIASRFYSFNAVKWQFIVNMAIKCYIFMESALKDEVRRKNLKRQTEHYHNNHVYRTYVVETEPFHGY